MKILRSHGKVKIFCNCIFIGPDFLLLILTDILFLGPSILFVIFIFGKNGVILSTISIIFIFLITFLIHCTAFSDPGFLLKQKRKHRKTKKSKNGYKFCKTCKIVRPPRSKHCRYCDNCVLLFDHHCPWLGTCVALRNYRIFFILVSVSNFFAFYVFVQSVVFLSSKTVLNKKIDFFDVIRTEPIIYPFITKLAEF
ncbi:hypothetical protein MHBO_005293 [Bonamia ostreae]|uniref:Palmitoyltransferase n=1 Tax=Bonamia ostreae TaxID=126728 RepID=A0ABV2AIV1_9EUKA